MCTACVESEVAAWVDERPDHLTRAAVVGSLDRFPISRLGTTDDCGFSPFGDDTSTARETAFAKISARITSTALAAQALGLS
jgi:5-methyltetrahydropteroyltriglutamate--homocysteine methyltransferase